VTDGRANVPRRVLLIQTRHIGDVVVSTALLEQLHAAHPGVTSDWLAAPETAVLLERHPLVAERLELRPGALLDVARQIRRRRYDWVVDVQGSWQSALVTRLSAAHVRIGWRGAERGWAYTHRVPRAGADSSVYVVRDRARLLRAAGVPMVEALPRLYLGDEERIWARGVLDELAPGRQRAGMLISTRFPHKDWAPEKFAAVARGLAGDGVATVVFRAPGGSAKEDAFQQEAGSAATFARPVPIRGLMALIAGCDVFISADTGPAHIATALGVPRVTVYGPTPAAGWTPESAFAIAVRDGAARCAACAGKGPDTAHTCLESVTPQMVLAPVRELLRAHERKPSPLTVVP
jgi:ADP-heptose:LPS heptosyltransferase